MNVSRLIVGLTKVSWLNMNWEVESKVLDSIVEAAMDKDPITVRCPVSAPVDRKVDVKVVESKPFRYTGCNRDD